MNTEQLLRLKLFLSVVVFTLIAVGVFSVYADENFIKIGNNKYFLTIEDSNFSTTGNIKIVNSAFFSENTIILNHNQCSNLGFEGWNGAISTIPATGKYTKYTTTNILVKLTDQKNNLSGYTQKGKGLTIITIYNVDKLKDYELSLIIKHELGHALGLKHTKDPRDLMNNVIYANSVISQCNVKQLLLNGEKI